MRGPGSSPGLAELLAELARAGAITLTTPDAHAIEEGGAIDLVTVIHADGAMTTQVSEALLRGDPARRDRRIAEHQRRVIGAFAPVSRLARASSRFEAAFLAVVIAAPQSGWIMDLWRLRTGHVDPTSFAEHALIGLVGGPLGYALRGVAGRLFSRGLRFWAARTIPDLVAKLEARSHETEEKGGSHERFLHAAHQRLESSGGAVMTRSKLAPEEGPPPPQPDEATARAAAAASRPDVIRAKALLGEIAVAMSPPTPTVPVGEPEGLPHPVLADPGSDDDPTITTEVSTIDEEDLAAADPASAEDPVAAAVETPASPPASVAEPAEPARPRSFPGPPPPAQAIAPPAVARQRPLAPGWSAALLAWLTGGMLVVGLSPDLPAGPAWLIEVGLLAAAMAVVGLAATGKVFGVLVNAQKLVSPARFQAVLWTVVVLSAYCVVVLRRTRVPDPMGVAIDGHLWALVGMSAALLVGTPLLQNRKRSAAPQAGVTQATAQALGQPVEELERYSSGILYAKPSIGDARFGDLFRGEEVGSAPYVDLNEVQMLFFTVLTAVLYAVSLYRLLGTTDAAAMSSLPTLPAGLLAVLGLSYAANLGSKLVRHTPVKADALTGPVGPTEAELTLKAILDGARRSLEAASSIDRAAAAQARSARHLVQVVGDLAEASKRQQARAGRDLGGVLSQVADALGRLNGAQQAHARGSEQLLHAAHRLEESARAQEQVGRRLLKGVERPHRSG